MDKLELKNIQEIKKNPSGKGYLIVFQNGQTILMQKRRTIPALLTLIKHGEGCEKDLTESTNNLQQIPGSDLSIFTLVLGSGKDSSDALSLPA